MFYFARLLSCSLLYLLPSTVFSSCQENITDQISSYKFKDYDELETIKYSPPPSCIFEISRNSEAADPLHFYFSKPPQNSYSIAILCGGSQTRESVYSSIHLHRYFQDEFFDCGCAVVTVESLGVSSEKIDRDAFMNHYTRSARIQDHQRVIDFFSQKPPKGWDGRFVFAGFSEGGILVDHLSVKYSDCCAASINWCGGGSWSWRKELWSFIKALRQKEPEAFSSDFSRSDYDEIMKEAYERGSTTKEFMGMSYAYHKDAMDLARLNPEDLKAPYLLVAGTDDSIIGSADEFAELAGRVGAPVTYCRVEGMGHLVRLRSDIMAKNFQWLYKVLWVKSDV